MLTAVKKKCRLFSYSGSVITKRKKQWGHRKKEQRRRTKGHHSRHHQERRRMGPALRPAQVNPRYLKGARQLLLNVTFHVFFRLFYRHRISYVIVTVMYFKALKLHLFNLQPLPLSLSLFVIFCSITMTVCGCLTQEVAEESKSG